MRDPNPTVMLIPGLGMVAWGKNKSESRVTAEFYNCAIEVMRGAEAIDTYEAMDQQEAFDIEYWKLEEAKLRRLPPEKELDRQVIAVIGAGAGIGKATAHRLVREGAHIVAVDRDAAAAQATADEIVARYGEGIGVAGTGISNCGPAIGLACDVTDRGSVRRMFADVMLAYGGLDAVVITAGIFVPPDRDGRVEDQMWALTFGINVTGAYIVADEAHQIFRRQGLPATIVLTTSANAVVAKKGSLAYDTSKAAANHLVRELAVEMAPLVRVNAVAPATVVKGSTMFPRDRVVASLAKYGIAFGEDEVDRRPARPAGRLLRHPVAHRVADRAGGSGRGDSAARERAPREDHRAHHPGGRRAAGWIPAVVASRTHSSGRDGGIPWQRVSESMTRASPPPTRSSGPRCARTSNISRDVLRRTHIDIEALVARAAGFTVAIPSWGVGTGGTRFARFPGPGEPRDIHEKLDDCAVIFRLVRATPAVSLHIPWDSHGEPGCAARVRRRARAPLRRDELEHLPGPAGSGAVVQVRQPLPSGWAVRRQAIAHNLECIEIGKAVGSTALSVWIGDGGNFPGQMHIRGSLERYLESMREIYSALPADWRLFVEHKEFEPAFYSTVVNDWGTSYYCARELGPQAWCLVDLGHHAPNVNIEMVVARLLQLGKLGGFHFNDSKYGDDDLDAGSIKPFQLFLIFNELVDAELEGLEGFTPAYMIDQSHNVTDPIESLMVSAMEVVRAYVQAHLVDREALAAAQQRCDALGALALLKAAYHTDVTPILATARLAAGGAIDPVATYRGSGYRQRKAEERPTQDRVGAGIV